MNCFIMIRLKTNKNGSKKMYDKESYNIKSKCPVCGGLIFMNSVGNGDKCNNCGWDHSHLHDEFPDRVMCPNLISLNKAKKLYQEGKPLVPDFNDFIEGFNFYGEMEFVYKGITYGIASSETEIEFWGVNTEKNETFRNIKEFQQKAKIQGQLVKDIWNEVENVNWLQ